MIPSATQPVSIWNTTAHPTPPLPALEGDVQTDVVIVGAGFTGLAAAHHLSQRGVRCALVEALDVGWGASGRSGGMAVLRYKKPWAVLARQLGNEGANRLHGALHQAVDLLEATVGVYSIDCGFARCGHITAAHGKAALSMLEADTQWLAQHARDRAPRILSVQETNELTGTDRYVGGYLDPRAAGIHPLNYTRGLAASLDRAGVPIFVGSPVKAVREDVSGITVETPRGTLRAQQALFATNAYTDLNHFGTDLHRRIVPVSTSVITTAPLPDTTLQRILPQRHLVSDTRHLLNYFRIAPGNRLLYGGRGSITGRESLSVYAGLERKLVETFPILAGVPVDHRWSGKVAVTLDDFPHIGRLSTRTAYAMGYGGRGVALTNLLGKLLADLALGERIEAGPMTANSFAPIPLHGLRRPAMKAVAGYYRLLDALRL